MTITQITRALERHGIAYEVIDDRVMAEEHYTINCVPYTDIIDLTDISPEKLYDWLGY